MTDRADVSVEILGDAAGVVDARADVRSARATREHGHDHAHHQDDRKRGPAKIATVEERYAGDLTSRFRNLKGTLRTKVDDQDGFGLRDGDRSQTLVGQAPREFAFPDDAKKEQAFMDWLNRQLKQDILLPVSGDRLVRGRHYTGVYVRQGYGRGLRHADRQLRRTGFDIDRVNPQSQFTVPIHRDQLRLLYRRQFRGLEGITDAAGTELSRVLTEGLAAGENPRMLANTLTETVDDVGIARAETLARTELSRSYNTAAAKRYQQHGVEQVTILTSDPCPVCQDLAAGAPYPVDKAAGLLPAHPNCVCSLSPVIS